MKDSAELAKISSHPTSGSEIFVLLKTSPICEKLKLNPINIKRPKNLAVLTVFVEYGVINCSYPMMAKSMDDPGLSDIYKHLYGHATRALM